MKETELRKELMQASEEEARELVKNLMRQSVRQGLLEALKEEVNLLCGQRHHPDPESEYYRAGSEQGVIYSESGKEPLKRPRVRHKEQGEVVLEVYRAASDPKNLFDEIVATLSEGVSCRGAERLSKGAISKSAASRMWQDKSREQLETLRSRPLAELDLVCLMIDGIWLCKEVCVVVALGIDNEGKKHALDFEQGSSESKAVVKGLLERLVKRGLDSDANRRLLVLRDGSQAIAGAVSEHFPNAVQQECLVHLHRQVRDTLRKRDRAEVDSLFKTWRGSQGKKAGEEAFEDLIDFIAERNGALAVALREREDALLAFHRLDVTSTLNVTFLSTNIIENSIRNWREQTGNVKLWKEKGDMVSRWTASGLLSAESTFRRIRHHGDLTELISALETAGESPPAPDSDESGKTH